MQESADVRLARIEEGLVHLHSKMDERHQEIKTMLSPLIHRVEKHHVAIALNSRDKKWIYSIAAFLGGVAGAIVKYLPHA